MGAVGRTIAPTPQHTHKVWYFPAMKAAATDLDVPISSKQFFDLKFSFEYNINKYTRFS